MKLNREQLNELLAAVRARSAQEGVDPKHVLTAMLYETGGTLDPWQKGPTTKWGTHRGLIQWGEPQARQYGITANSSITDQVNRSFDYLKDRGVKPGMGMLDIYSTINAGRPGLYNRSDAHVGGAPGTVADKVASATMQRHMTLADSLLGNTGTPGVTLTSALPPVPPANVPVAATPQYVPIGPVPPGQPPLSADVAPAVAATPTTPPPAAPAKAPQNINELLAQTPEGKNTREFDSLVSGAQDIAKSINRRPTDPNMNTIQPLQMQPTVSQQMANDLFGALMRNRRAQYGLSLTGMPK